MGHHCREISPGGQTTDNEYLVQMRIPTIVHRVRKLIFRRQSIGDAQANYPESIDETAAGFFVRFGSPKAQPPPWIIWVNGTPSAGRGFGWQRSARIETPSDVGKVISVLDLLGGGVPRFSRIIFFT